MCKDRKVAHVIANSRKNLVIQDVYTDHFLDVPMPQDRKDMFTLMKFFEDRCFPRTRANCDELLKELGLKEYNPYLICIKTRGQQWDDFYWIRFKGDIVEYKDIKLRD